jgi:hypothetical protein
MLKEIPREIVEAKKGEKDCRWFRDDYFDLFVWTGEDGIIASFHLYYDIYGDQKVLIWDAMKGATHGCVDEGEMKSGKPKAMPVVSIKGEMDSDLVFNEFLKRSGEMDRSVSEFIRGILYRLSK